MYFNVRTLKKNLLNIICNMGFEDKTYGFKSLSCSLVAIKLKLQHLSVQGRPYPRGGFHCFLCL